MLKRWCLAASRLMLAGLLMKPAAVAAESARSFRQQNGLLAYAPPDWFLSLAPLLESVDRIDVDIEQFCDVVFGFDPLGMAASGGNESDLVILPYLSHHHLVDQLGC